MNSFLKKILSPCNIEYVVLNAELLILETSLHIKRFADCPEEVEPGKDVRLAFPELLGFEEILLAILQKQQATFELKGIARCGDQKSPLYLDLYASEFQEETTLENQLIILFEEVTEKMVLQQSLIQRANEANLLASALATAKNYIDKIIQAMADALLVTTISGQIKTVNRAAQELFGYREAELINQPLSMIITDNNFWFRSASEQLGLAEGELFKDLEVVCQTKTGQEVYVAFSGSVLQTDIEGLQDFVYIGRDITERKQAEAEIRKALAKERELNELKSRFVSMASHEFRTPLSTILSSSELLEYYSDNWPKEKKLAHLHRIQTAVKNMSQLLNDVLIIGKAEAGKLTFNPEPLDLCQFCHELVEDLSLNKEVENNKINFVISGGCKIAALDEKLLRHILTNLLSNAIKYSPSGSTVKFELVYQDDEAIFQIQDVGIGIPSADLVHLFESFHRATNVGNISGTGLGLAIAKKCVELHRGAIAVKSEVDVGTTFEVRIPLN